MLNDVRYAIRALRAAPAFTLVAAATLALGIAVNTIAFTLINSLALRPLPVRDAARVVRIYPVGADGSRGNLFSYPDYLDYRDEGRTLEGMVAYIPAAVTLGRDNSADPIREGIAYAVSTSFFPVLGIRPAVGRTFMAAEEAAPDARVAIISHALWQRRHGGSPDVLGRTVTVNGRPFSIVGVGPERFVGTEPLAVDVWLPLAAQPILEGSNALADRGHAWLLVLGRMRPGGAPAAVEQNLSVVTSRLAAAYPGANRPARAAVAPATFVILDGGVRSVIALVLGAVALVLVIACANIANLSLARGLSRRRDVATRLALGASRWRVVRQLLAESVVVAALGGLGGSVLSAWTLRLLMPIGLSLIPEVWASVLLDLTPDVRVLAYTCALAIAAGLAFGLLPALQSSAPAIAPALRGDGALLGVRFSQSRARGALVVLQISSCLMLLSAAALAARGLQRTQALDLGFRADAVVHTAGDLRRHGYDRQAASRFYARLGQRAASLPGVASVALTSHVPLTGGVTRALLTVEGHAAPVMTMWSEVSEDYFRTLDIPVVAGRAFTADDLRTKAPVAIISAGLARRFWPEPLSDGRPAAGAAHALGRRVVLPQSAVPLIIVGVARDASDAAIWREKELTVYVPISTVASDRNLHLLVRTTDSPRLVADELAAAAASLDADVRFAVRPLNDVLRIWLLPSRVAAITALVLGLLALSLASMGIWGVMSCAVTERRREIGIRVALGATASAAVHAILRDGARLIGAGLAIGSAGAFATARILANWLPGVSALDVTALAAAAIFLSVVAWIACYLPSRRAARIDPMVALRAE